MHYKDEQFVVIKDFVTLKDKFLKETILNLNYKENNAWYFLTDDNRELVINPNSPNEYIQNANEYFEEKIRLLDEKNLHFGQLELDDNFYIDKNCYTKIGSYTMYKGTDKEIVINTVKHPIGEDSFDIDNYNFYFKDREFLFFDDNFVVRYDYVDFFNRKREFMPLEELQVTQFYKDFPQMFDVLACFFEKRELSFELKNVFEKYTVELDHLEHCYEYPQYFSISEIKQQIKEEAEKNDFKETLINKKLK